MQREYPNRPFSAVGVVVIRGDSVLLIRRGKPPRTGELSLPGGAQKLGETVIEAAQRELREETGLKTDTLHLVDVVDSITRDDQGRIRYQYTLCDFVALDPAGTAVAASDADEVIWVPVSEIAFLDLWDETRRIIRKAAEIAQSSLDFSVELK